MKNRKTLPRALLAALFAAFFIITSSPPAAAEITEVTPGGEPFGVKLLSDGPTVVSFAEFETDRGAVSPARDAGIAVGDVITEVNGKKIASAEELVEAVGASDGRMTLTLKRDSKERTVELSAAVGKDGRRRIGLMIRDGTAGIGTVTFVLPDTRAFMGLGHGVCDSATGEIADADRGVVETVTVTGAVKSEAGDPGELKGRFTGEVCGEIRKNTEAGVFGYLTSFDGDGTIPVGCRADVREGDAKIVSTVGPDGPREYAVTIENVPIKKSARSFEIRVTDPALIAETGGIVQGMSGSPVVQDGKLIGAVTHVMVNDPVRGYAIFIDEMLAVAEE